MLRPASRERVAMLLYPPADATAATAAWVSLACGAFVGGTVLGLMRQTGSGAMNTLYAEDGQIFLGQALRHGGGRALTTAYMGYFHMVPRLLAGLASIVPLRLAAATMAVAASAIVAALALVVYRASAGLVRSPVTRAVLASSMVLLPLSQEEVFNNIANLHWFLIFTSVWVLLWNPTKRVDLVVGATVLVLAGLSDPLNVLLTPIALLRLVSLRGWRHHAFTAAYAAGVGGQLLAIVLSGARRSGLSPSFNIAEVVGQYPLYVVGRGIFGMRWLRATGGGRVALLTALALVLLGVLVAVAWVRTGRPPAPAALLLFAVSGLFYLVTVMLGGVSPPRYAVVPVLLLFSAVAVVVDGWMTARPDRTARLAATCIVLLVAVTWSANYRDANRRSTGRKWGTELSRAHATCEQSGRATVRVAISPPGWRVDVPCRDVLASGANS